MKRILGLTCSAYRLFEKGASYLQSPLLLVVRLFWGWSFFQAGKDKLTDLEQATENFRNFGLPAPGLNAAMAGTVECVGGMLLLLGLASRPAAAALSFTMIVAYLTTKLDAVKGIFGDPDSFLEATPFQFLFAAVLVLAFGPGLFSMDRLIGWFWKRRAAGEMLKA